MRTRILTGVTPSGIPHLGNYVGAIRPAITASQSKQNDSFFFLSDYHALIKCKNAALIEQSTKAVVAAWLAAGLDYEKVTFYRQSDVPEVLELNWILTTCCAKGLMSRAHAYKAAVQENIDKGLPVAEEDHAIEMGLYCYPILMAADILMMNANYVPVGKDQIQHIEMTRDIASRFNHRYGKLFNLPKARVDENIPLLNGLDGRKMSKSYGNTIPLFAPEEKLRQAIMKIVTNSQAPGEPKLAEDSNLYAIYTAFANQKECQQLKEDLLDGLSWGEAKQRVFTIINRQLSPKREIYQQLLSAPKKMEEILQYGAEKARYIARPLLLQVKKAVGLSPVGMST